MGPLFDEFRDSKASLMYTPIFMLRRVVIVVTASLLPDWPFSQVIITYIASFLNLLYLINVKPFKIAIMNKIEIINESTYLIASYHTIGFLDICEDPEMRYFFFS